MAKSWGKLDSIQEAIYGFIEARGGRRMEPTQPIRYVSREHGRSSRWIWTAPCGRRHDAYSTIAPVSLKNHGFATVAAGASKETDHIAAMACNCKAQRHH
jgi:hypothetical protein